jgi:hypothetical protein
VIAYKAGGALDTVKPNLTGEFFEALTVESLMQAMQSFDATRYHGTLIREHALQFDTQVFKQQLHDYITQAYQAHPR